MKKILLMFFIIMLFTAMPVLAEDSMGEGFAYDFTLDEDASDEAELFAMTAMEKEAMHHIIACIGNRKGVATLSSYNISTTRLRHVVSMAFLEAPDLCYVSGTYRYYYNTYTNIVTYIEIEYNCNDSAIDGMMKEVQRERDKILDLIDKDMTELEKVMLVHNYIVANHEYDYSYTIYDIHGFFTSRKGTCSAYSKAMTYILRAAGVECSYARSNEMNHVWNLVKIDGMWYHVDATWDDPNDRVGYCSYTYFLKSDDYFEKHCDHYSWESDYMAKSAWYDEYYFKSYNSPMQYYEGEWYAEKNGGIYKITNLKYGGEELVYKPEGNYWSYMEFGIFEGSLIFSLKDGVYVYNPKDYAKERRFIGEGNVYSMKVQGEKLYYQTGDYSYDDFTLHETELEELVSIFPFSFLNLSYKEGKLQVGYTYDDFYKDTWKLYLAAYDEDNTLICLKELPRRKYSIEMPEAARYEAFIWEEACVPLCENVQKEM